MSHQNSWWNILSYSILINFIALYYNSKWRYLSQLCLFLSFEPSVTKLIKNHHWELILVFWAMKEQLLSRFLWVFPSHYCDLQGAQNTCHISHTIQTLFFSAHLYYFYIYINDDSVQLAMSHIFHTLRITLMSVRVWAPANVLAGATLTYLPPVRPAAGKLHSAANRATRMMETPLTARTTRSSAGTACLKEHTPEF